MKATLQIPRWIFLFLIVAAGFSCCVLAWQWHRAAREAALNRDALEELGVRCVGLDHNPAGMICATSEGHVFAVGFQPAHSEGDDQ